MQIYEEKFMRFPGGKGKALTFSYDDGVIADKRLVQLFNKYNLKATFNLNSLLFASECKCWHGRMGEQETLETFVDTRHEVALHGARHIFFDRVPLYEATNEVVQNRVQLENMFNRIVRGMAYPYHAYSKKIRDMLEYAGVVYARTTVSTYSFDIPSDWLMLNPTCHHGDKRLSELTDTFLNAKPDNTSKNRDPLLFYVWGHSFEFDEKNQWDIIENFAERVANRDDIWYATNIEVYDYVKAYESLIYSIDGERVYNPSAIPVWVQVRGKIYKIDSGKNLVFDKP